MLNACIKFQTPMSSIICEMFDRFFYRHLTEKEETIIQPGTHMIRIPGVSRVRKYKVTSHNRKWTILLARVTVFAYCLVSCSFMKIEVKSMQRTGTEAIRTQIQPSKPKPEIIDISNSQNTKRTYGQPSEQLVPKTCPLSNRNRTKIIGTHVR